MQGRRKQMIGRLKPRLYKRNPPARVEIPDIALVS